MCLILSIIASSVNDMIEHNNVAACSAAPRNVLWQYASSGTLSVPYFVYDDYFKAFFEHEWDFAVQDEEKVANEGIHIFDVVLVCFSFV